VRTRKHSAAISNVQDLTKGWFQTGKIEAHLSSLSSEVSVVKSLTCFGIHKSITHSKADFGAGERSEAFDVMKDLVYGVLMLGPLNQNYKSVPTVTKHKRYQYQRQEPTKFGPDHLLAFEFQTYAFAK
jgi:hypothetical protein